jgi:predicted Rossmann fold nucleotide-binding protein DprA/Smf involved in DNA uptake
MAEALVQFNLDLIQLEEEKADLPGKIKACRSRIDEMSRTLRAGWEFRDVDCEERFNGGTIETVRLDTMEVVETRAATQEDRQVGIPFGETPVETPFDEVEEKKDERDFLQPESLTESLTEENELAMGEIVLASMTEELMSVKEISDSSNVSQRHVTQMLKAWMANGKVLRQGKRYRLISMSEIQ